MSGIIAGAFAAVVMHVSVATAQFTSIEPAQQLALFFNRTGLGAFAAADPSRQDAFVGAVHVGGALLVVGASHPATGELTRLIQLRRFLDVYSRLRATPTPAGKFFVKDANANGLLTALPGSANMDEVRVEGGPSQPLVSDFSRQDISAEEYDAFLVDADGRYARL